MEDKLQAEAKAYQALQQEYSKAVANRQQLESQLKENEQVQQEFSNLKEDSTVYKLVGPVLVKYDKDEAESNVSKRIDYIKRETKRVEELIKTIEEKQEKKKLEIVKLQTAYQQQQEKMAKA